MRLIYDSMVKYFSGLSLPIHWMITPRNLPPSNAGNGKILKIANAKEIMPANAKNNLNHHSFKSVCQIFTAPTGPVSLLSTFFIFVPSKEMRFLPSVPSVTNVRSASARISLSPIHNDFHNGNLISWIAKLPER